MDEINFLALAPRRGTQPMLSAWSDIGTSQMNGGAFSWGNLWSGLKTFGSSVKNWGSKAWNSSTGQALRDKLKDTKVQEKIVDAISTGVHGAIDLTQQQLENAIAKRLEKRPTVEPRPPEEDLAVESTVAPSVPVEVTDVPKIEKRPRDDDDIVEVVEKIEGPPSYESLFGNQSVPMTRPALPMARPVLKPPTVPPLSLVDTPTTLDLPPPTRAPAIRRSSARSLGWQGKLNSIVGVGVRPIKRRRCY
ncbi:pVI [Tree shrew adenovirus 1]|uniref:Pre-protein VI n=1 Tax=Tree shrew adenovirus serotype 1 TaxID=47680 RepID=A0A2U9AG92_ADET1|nr:pVI [Tree shrew adenovirus 1]